MASLCAVFATLILASVLSQILAANAQPAFGVCYGMQGDNLPSPAEVIKLYKNHNIGTMQLYDPNPEALQALVNSGISVILGTKDEDLHNLASSVEAAKSWIDTHVEPYQGVNIKYIVVGNEVIPGELALCVLPAMQNLRSALSGSSFSSVAMSTAVSGTVLGASYPPSSGAFTEDAKSSLSGILQFLSDTHAPLLINAYPYFAYAADPTHIRLDYAQFTAPGPVARDGDLSYWNLLDAMVDAYYAAMERENFPNVGVVISESGWPSAGNGNFTTPQLALTYNQNFLKKIKAGTGTPKRPDSHLDGNIFVMFNENLKSAGVEQNFGLFYPNGTPVYPIFA
ncbi:hypothetical protein BT93_C0342 [Corymbia citriodora subsp. variegata]|nr:hypothetical protein BT93_C0342 [Corymbia citriodora subsp. variegata]